VPAQEPDFIVCHPADVLGPEAAEMVDRVAQGLAQDARAAVFSMAVSEAASMSSRAGSSPHL
jgi:hypothetical protein